MGGVARLRDIGALISPRGGGAARITAAGAGDNTEVNGPWIDRTGFESVMASVAWRTTLTAAKTLAIAGNLQDATSAAGAAAADFGTALASIVVSTGAQTTLDGVTRIGDFDLSDARQFIRLQFTPDLNAGSADIGDLAGQLILGGAVETPAV